MTTQALTDHDWAKVGLWGPPAPRRAWGPPDAAYGVGWLLAANLALAVPVLIWMVTADQVDVQALTTNPLILTAGLLTLWSVFVGVPVLTTRRYGLGSLSADFGFRMPVRAEWRTGLVVGLGMRVVDISMGLLATKIGWTAGDNSTWLFTSSSALMTAFYVASGALIAPVLEELFFRGFIMRAIARAKRLTGRWASVVPVVASSLIFGLLHTTAMDTAGLYVACSTAVAGGVLAVLAWRSGNLGASIATHIVFNTTGVIGAWVMAR